MKYLLFASAILLNACGNSSLSLSVAADPTPAPESSPSPSPSPLVKKTYCSQSFMIGGAQVEKINGDGSQTPIPNGVYSYTAYLQNGFFVPACSYTVLDGSIFNTGESVGFVWD